MRTETLQARRVPAVPVSIGGLAAAAGSVVVVSSLLGFLGPLWWFFDLFAHFRVQYAVSLLLLFVALAASGRWSWAGAFAVAALLNIATIAPFYLGARHAQTASSAYRALLLNVQAENDRYDRVRAVIRRYDPDILVLLETNRAWLGALEVLRDVYPYAILRPRDRHGMALYSRLPLEKHQVIAIGRPDDPTIKAELRLGERRLTVLAMHTLSPISGDYSRVRNEQLAAIPDLLPRGGGPALVLADLNITPWSSHFQRLLQVSGLRDSSAGRGVQATWPVPAPMFLIPIDHCLHSPDVAIVERSVGPAVGSDHYPVIVDFAFRSR